MKPREKAIELIEKAGDYIYTSNAHYAEDDAEKNCALMVVSEIINIASADINYEFWEEVKKEIKNL